MSKAVPTDLIELEKQFAYVDAIINRHRTTDQFVQLAIAQIESDEIVQLPTAQFRDVKRDNENPSIGIILCPSADRSMVEYTLSRSLSPTMVAEYQSKLIPQEVMQRSLDEYCTFLDKKLTEKQLNK